MSIDVEFGADLKLAIGDLTKEMRKRNEKEQARIEAAARRIPFAHSKTSNDDGDGFTLNVCGPDRGYVWLLRRLWVGGNTVTDTPDGTGYFFVRTNDPIGDLSPTTLIGDFTHAPFPQIAYYSNEQVPITGTERLWGYIATPTASTQYVVTGEVLQFTEREYREVFSI